VVEYVHDWFQELDRARPIGPHGPEGLTYQTIDVWARLPQRSPTPMEVQALLWMDVVKRFPNAGETVG
jgi:hypothetical protein